MKSGAFCGVAPLLHRRRDHRWHPAYRPATEEPCNLGARHRLYRATSSAQFVLDANDQRIPVDLS
jgi:hypothetical protein